MRQNTATESTDAGRAPTPPIQAFIAEIEALIERAPAPVEMAANVQARLSTLVTESDLLWPEQREPWAETYRPHLVAVAPSRRFSVMALVWLPGQTTAIHDHICWCVVCPLKGVEREERFHLRRDGAGEHWLAPEGDVYVRRGETSSLVPPEENIHRVRNAGDTLAISLHVYGADLAVMKSSVNACFDDLPIRDQAGEPVPWRLIRGA